MFIVSYTNASFVNSSIERTISENFFAQLTLDFIEIFEKNIYSYVAKFRAFKNNCFNFFNKFCVLIPAHCIGVAARSLGLDLRTV